MHGHSGARRPRRCPCRLPLSPASNPPLPPLAGKIYAFNEGNYQLWSEEQRAYIDSLKNPDLWGGKPYSARYIGSLVGDFHRTLLYGEPAARGRGTHQRGTAFLLLLGRMPRAINRSILPCSWGSQRASFGSCTTGSRASTWVPHFAAPWLPGSLAVAGRCSCKAASAGSRPALPAVRPCAPACRQCALGSAWCLFGWHTLPLRPPIHACPRWHLRLPRRQEERQRQAAPAVRVRPHVHDLRAGGRGLEGGAGLAWGPRRPRGLRLGADAMDVLGVWF